MSLTTPIPRPVAPARAKRAARWRVLRTALQRPSGLVGLILAILMVMIGVLAPIIAPASPEATDFGALLQPPSFAHLFGTDELGRDQLSRVMYGIGASVQIGLLSVLLAALVGVPLGLIAGYYPKLDSPIARFLDVMLAFPNLILAVGLAAILGPSATNAMIALAVGGIPGFARVIRGEVFRLRGLDFVQSAVAAGAGDGRVLFRHILPNASSALLVQITVSIPHAVLGEAALSFLGLGIRPPAPSLGTMLSNAQPFLQTGPWMAVFPGLTIILITLAFNLFGDAMRDALDPKGRRR
ncbi:ABC transporter permease [Microbacterium sp. MYb62]|uniref:ABC transporter permease n=1 Tax=Microbacterium sp. MYb62 TaxID=1848690 RepID=UPI000CFBBDB1|nr:ABC transporter permease [Microbacterium sp. MYb62]PRB18603.1 ABC transporter permease [Microbacterium sp. MYb62]